MKNHLLRSYLNVYCKEINSNKLKLKILNNYISFLQNIKKIFCIQQNRLILFSAITIFVELKFDKLCTVNSTVYLKTAARSQSYNLFTNTILLKLGTFHEIKYGWIS